ncbi:pseudouridine synthase [Methylocystis sp. Sn-Cys]|uniref:pseudouridine synthase n=1 Tax=Methylocystis sp. Sn-Cys TaxID=1701263 RepID=UPI001920D3E6|nr:pseudouridine synthase [Methylocystis sp. Sn-Cys]MBL1255418.1 pseudouridine synthase [Methylocystis sp. Sn-Cys]
MADKKPTKRSGAPGGDRPMRRRDSKTAARDGAPKKFDSDKPKFNKPRGEKAAKPQFDKPRPAAKRTKPIPAPVEKTSAFEGERIAKAMARAGVCSRRDAEEWIAEGRIAVNGETLTSPAVNVTEADKITIDGEPMQARERTRLFLFHKPQGLVTTASDPEGRPTVFAYLDEKHPDLPRLVSVGRLDINTEGLLLLTNDGGLARTLELPATGWTRRYRVRVHGEIDQAQLDELKKGVTVEDVTYAPIEARLERVQGGNAWIALSLTEGKNREVKRVMEHLGLDVTRLIRVSYGPFQLGELGEGVVEEVKLKTLREQLGKSLAELAGADFASPLREATPTEQQEQRERTEKRSRKHVSVLRKQRDENAEKGPRARIERTATADRKGRAVAVERVTLTRRKPAAEDEAPSRNAKRFDAMRTGRRPRRDEAEAERPARGAARGARGEGFGRDDRRGAENRHPRFEGERESGRGAARGARGEGFARDDRHGAENRRPRFEGERESSRGPARGGRGEGFARDDRRSGENRRPRFEGERGERAARPPRERDTQARRDHGDATAARGHARTRTHEGDQPRAERRPPRRDGEAPRRARGADEREARPRKFEGPRAERGFARGGDERKSQRPRSGEGRTSGEGAPRGARSGGPRKGPPKGPPKGRGPGKGPSKGPSRGPRKPRGE